MQVHIWANYMQLDLGFRYKYSIITSTLPGNLIYSILYYLISKLLFLMTYYGILKYYAQVYLMINGAKARYGKIL
jgi:hypothetical protein